MEKYKEDIRDKIEKKITNLRRKNKLISTLNNLKTKNDIKLWSVRNNLNLNHQQTLSKKQITQPKKQTIQPKKQTIQPNKQTIQPKKQIVIQQIPKELKTLKYYDSSFNVKCTIFEDKHVHLNLSGKNARVVLNIEIEKKEDYIDWYPNLPDDFYSDIRIHFLYRREKDEEAPAPKDYTRKMLCYGLLYCIEQGFVNKNSIITVMAEHSKNDELLKKVYIPIGFKVITVDKDDDTTLMKSTVGRLLSWCDTQYNKQSNKKQQSFYNKIINLFTFRQQSEVDKQILKLYTSRKELQIRKEQFEQLLKNLNNTKYYDSSYKIKFTRNKKWMNDNSAKDVLIIEGKNAEVMLYINDLKKEDYKNYANIPRNFSSNIHLASLYRQTDEDLPPAPKNYTRRMLCYALLYCIKQKYIRKEYTYITLEAEYSENDELIKKVYMPMGFEVVGKDKYNDMTLMRSTIEKLLYWCHKKY